MNGRGGERERGKNREIERDNKFVRRQVIKFDEFDELPRKIGFLFEQFCLLLIIKLCKFKCVCFVICLVDLCHERYDVTSRHVDIGFSTIGNRVEIFPVSLRPRVGKRLRFTFVLTQVQPSNWFHPLSPLYLFFNKS